MKKGALNLLAIRAGLPDSDTPLSVKETSETLIRFLEALSEVDPMFSAFTPLKRKDTVIDINILGVQGATDALIAYFLASTNWKHNKPTWDVRENPDEDTTQSTGNEFTFGFKDGGENRLSVTGNISKNTKHSPRIVFLDYFNQNTEHTYPFSWYEALLKAYVKFWQPQEATIGTSTWTRMNVKTGLGRISYFAHDYDKFDVPNDLLGVEYVKADGGRYLYICPKFTPELEAFKAQDATVNKVMEELRARVPEYTKPQRQ